MIRYIIIALAILTDLGLTGVGAMLAIGDFERMGNVALVTCAVWLVMLVLIGIEAIRVYRQERRRQ